MIKSISINAWMELKFSKFVLDSFDRNGLIVKILILFRSNGINF